MNVFTVELGHRAATGFAAVRPIAPPGAQGEVDKLMGYVLWGVIILFGLGVLVSVGAIVAGRAFGMRHVSTAGVIGLVVVFLAVIAYLVAPGIVNAMLGAGCVTLPGT